jgi:hypothetical protein
MGNDASQNPPHVYLSKSTPSKKVIEKKLLNCAVDATQKVPANTVVASTPVTASPVRCNTVGNQTSCTGGSSGGRVYSYDANDSLREQVRLQCLENVGVQRVYGFGESTKCPSGNQWAGWFDGRLTADELATIGWRRVSSVAMFGNSPVIGASGKMCVLRASKSETDAGVMSNLNYYPENFVELSLSERDALVQRSELVYPLLPEFYRTMMSSMTYGSLVAKMELTVDFCAKKMTSEEYANQLVTLMRQSGLGSLSAKDLLYTSYKDTCDRGNLNFM